LKVVGTLLKVIIIVYIAMSILRQVLVYTLLQCYWTECVRVLVCEAYYVTV